MARTGYTVKQLLSGAVDIMRLSEKELRRATRTLADAANKRLKALEESGYAKASPAFRGAQTAVKAHFSTSRADTRNQLMTKYITAQHFLEAKTSTKAGFEAFEKSMESRIEGYSSLTDAEKSNMWKAYERLKDAHAITGIGSDVVQSALVEKAKNGQSVDDIYSAISDELEQLYEQNAEANNIWENIEDDDNPFL